MVDRASRFLFAYASKSNDSRGVARKPLDTLSRPAMPLLIASDARGEFMAEMVTCFCQ